MDIFNFNNLQSNDINLAKSAKKNLLSKADRIKRYKRYAKRVPESNVLTLTRYFYHNLTH